MKLAPCERQVDRLGQVGIMRRLGRREYAQHDPSDSRDVHLHCLAAFVPHPRCSICHTATGCRASCGLPTALRRTRTSRHRMCTRCISSADGFDQAQLYLDAGAQVRFVNRAAAPVTLRQQAALFLPVVQLDANGPDAASCRRRQKQHPRHRQRAALCPPPTASWTPCWPAVKRLPTVSTPPGSLFRAHATRRATGYVVGGGSNRPCGSDTHSHANCYAFGDPDSHADGHANRHAHNHANHSSATHPQPRQPTPPRPRRPIRPRPRQLIPPRPRRPTPPQPRRPIHPRPRQLTPPRPRPPIRPRPRRHRHSLRPRPPIRPRPRPPIHLRPRPHRHAHPQPRRPTPTPTEPTATHRYLHSHADRYVHSHADSHAHGHPDRLYGWWRYAHSRRQRLRPTGLRDPCRR